MLMNAFDKPVQSNTEQAGRGHGFARMFDRVCAFLDERVGGASALIAACQSVMRTSHAAFSAGSLCESRARSCARRASFSPEMLTARCG